MVRTRPDRTLALVGRPGHRPCAQTFRTFSDWNDTDVEAVARAADELGEVVTEHYQSVLHQLKKALGCRA
jgi:hypothetical protein